MAKKTTFVSDLTGEDIQEGQEATVTIKSGDKLYVGDANFSEVEDLASRLREQKPRGRKSTKK